MGSFVFIIAIVLFAFLVVLATFQPVRPDCSLPELRRRLKGKKPSTLAYERAVLYSETTTTLRAFRVLALILLSLCLFVVLAWWALLVVGVLALLYPVIARNAAIRIQGQKLYAHIEPTFLAGVKKYQRVIRAFREPGIAPPVEAPRAHSRAELEEFLYHSKGAALTELELARVTAALTFSERSVAAVMTPRKAIKTVQRTEFLGPLVLDELHSFGHSHLVVIDETVDAIVGILSLEGHLTLDERKSKTAEKAMSKTVEYINDTETLEQTLRVFLRTKQHLLIVRDETRSVVGLITLSDVIGALIGTYAAPRT